MFPQNVVALISLIKVSTSTSSQEQSPGETDAIGPVWRHFRPNIIQSYIKYSFRDKDHICYSTGSEILGLVFLGLIIPG
jgi:hypothetical protein